MGASRRVFELLDRESKQPPAGDAQPKGSQGGGEIIFEDVWWGPEPLWQCLQCLRTSPLWRAPMSHTVYMKV